MLGGIDIIYCLKFFKSSATFVGILQNHAQCSNMQGIPKWHFFGHNLHIIPFHSMIN